MHTLGLSDVVAQLPELISKQQFPEAETLLYPALDQKPESGALWFYCAVINSLQGKQALALECFRKSQDLEPHPALWANIGAVLRQLGRVDECRHVLLKGLDVIGDDADIYANLAASYVNEGDPHTGISYGERGLELKPEHLSLKFNLALLHLEAGHYARGWDFYAEGAHHHRLQKSYEPDPPDLTPDLHDSLKGRGKRLIVWGEQGLGDELMFATIIEDAKRDYEILFDCHPRLESLHRRSRWAHTAGYPVEFFPTRKTPAHLRSWTRAADAKCPIGNLARFYRRTPEAFSWRGPQYHARPTERVEMRAQLEALAGGRKIIGLALRGGTMSTARLYRIISPDTLEGLLSDPSYLFVGLDYEDMTSVAQHIAAKYGPDRYVWHPSVCWAWDYDHTASLIAATDAVVTITQTIAHLSAAMEHPTFVLTPSRPDWRMGQSSDVWQWYAHPHARLLRQSGSDWTPAGLVLQRALQARFLAREAA